MELTYHRIKVLQNFGFVSLVRRKKERKERKIADRSMTKTKQIAQITEEMKSL